MVRLSTPHAHTSYVDGRDAPLAMIEAAISKGFQSLGFSEHGRQTFDPEYALTEAGEDAYIEEVTRLKRQFAGRIDIFLGVERDQYAQVDPARYQYVIGAKHYFRAGPDHFAGDGAIEDVLPGCHRFFGGDWYALAENYFSELAEFVVSVRPDIIAHFDVITKHNEGGGLFDERDRRYLHAGYEALERMLETGALLEVNTGAIARGRRSVPYSSLEFLTFWRERGGRAIVSSDCHDARLLDAGYDQAYALLEAAGYRTAWALGTDDALFVEYALP